MATPRFAWGIDVGNRALKAIKLVRDGEGLRIDDFEVIEHEQILSQAGDNRETLIQTALANFAQGHASKNGAVAIGVSGQSSFARFIKLPPVDPSKVADIVKFEAVQQIPFPLDEVEWSYQLFQAQDSPEVEVGIFAMKRELVNQILKNFTDVGIEVTTVQMSPLAVYNGLNFDKRIAGPTMVIDVGAENSDLIIAEGESVWMRSIPVGGNNFTEALVKSFKLKFTKAEELKRNAATSKYGRQILQAMKPVFSDLVGEIQRSIGFYTSTHRESRITTVLALGGTFRLPGLQKYLQQNLQLEVVRIDRLNATSPADARFAAAFNENILSSIGAYGLAIQAMGQGKIKSSLLPEKIRRERMWREKTRWFAAAAALFLVGTGISAGRLYADRIAYDNQLPARNRIETTASVAKRLDKEWKEIESSGSDDRLQITNSMALMADRDTAIDVSEALARAFEPRQDSGLPATAAWLATEMRKPRDQRRLVELIAWNMKYEPDIGPHVSADAAGHFLTRDDEFNPLAEKLDMNSGNTSTGGNGSMGGGAGGGAGPGGFGSKQAAAPRRGFLVTILCRTPSQDPTRLVHDTVAAELRKPQLLPSGELVKSFSIERVTIPSKIKVAAAFPSGIAHPRKAPLDFQRPVPAGGNAPAAAPVGGPTPGEVAGDPFADAMHKGESMANDSLVTMLVAIVIDPEHKEKSPAVSKTTGPQKPTKSGGN